MSTPREALLAEYMELEKSYRWIDQKIQEHSKEIDSLAKDRAKLFVRKMEIMDALRGISEYEQTK